MSRFSFSFSFSLLPLSFHFLVSFFLFLRRGGGCLEVEVIGTSVPDYVGSGGRGGGNIAVLVGARVRVD